MPTTMDHSKFRYENFENRPNVWLAFHLGAPATTFHINPLVLETARIMFRKAPKNTYIFSGPYHPSAERASFFTCTVERNGEVIGKLNHAYGRKGNSVKVENDRIARDRDRGGGMVTSDVKRAAALALKKFVPTSSEESLIKGYAIANDALRMRLVQVANARNNALNNTTDRLHAYVQQNWADEGQKLMHKIGLSATNIEEIDAALTAANQHHSLRDRLNKGITFVLQKDDTLYAVPMDLGTSHTGSLHQRAFSYADAPGDMRAKIGMLKVAEPAGVYYPDVGIRIGDTYAIFLDLDDVKDEEGEADDDADEED